MILIDDKDCIKAVLRHMVLSVPCVTVIQNYKQKRRLRNGFFIE